MKTQKDYRCLKCEGEEKAMHGVNCITRKSNTPAPKRARMETDEDYGNMSVFVYANGQPGDLEIKVNPGEIQSWREIVRAVNSHEEMLIALKAVYKNKEYMNVANHFASRLKEIIAKAEGK